MSRSTASGALLFLLLGSCRTPTQVTLTVYTELSCDPAHPSHTLIRIGSLGGLKGKLATVDTTTCVGGRVGSLVVLPSGDKSEVVGIEIVARDYGQGDPAACDDQSTDPRALSGCIFARRALAFVPHSELELPVDMKLSCVAKKCGPTQTCIDGTCEDALILDSTLCFADACRRSTPGKPGSDAGVDAPDVPDVPDGDGAISTDPWARAAGSTSGMGGAVAVASDGSLYGSFAFQGTANYERSLTATGLDTALVKYSASGAVLWSRQIGGDADEWVNSIHVHPSGDILVLGRTESGVFQPEGGAALPSPGGSGLYLARYTAAGALVYARRFLGGGDYPPFGGAALNAAGDLVVAQTVTNTVEWDGTSRGGIGDLDVAVGIFAAKDGAGSNVAIFGGLAGSFTRVSALAIGKDGAYLVGQYSDTFAGLPKAQADDAFLLALDGSLKQRWAVSTVDVGTAGAQLLGAVTMTSEGDVFAMGATLADGVRIAGHDLTGPGSFAVQLDAAGAWVRGQTFPTGIVVTHGALDLPMALARGPAGDLTFVATTQDDTTTPKFTFDSKLAPLTQAGSGDILLVQLTSSATGIIATRQRIFGDGVQQSAGRLVRTADGDIVFAGTYAGALDLKVTPALPPGGTGQSYITRLKP